MLSPRVRRTQQDTMWALTRVRQTPFSSGFNSSSISQWRPTRALTGEPRPLIQPVTLEEVERALKSLWNDRATGPEGLNYELLKYAEDAILTVISHTINTVLLRPTPHLMHWAKASWWLCWNPRNSSGLCLISDTLHSSTVPGKSCL